MSVDELIDEHVSLKQAKLAVNALHNHAKKQLEEKEENELLPGKEQHVWLVVAVKKIYPERKVKPFKLPVKHALVDPRQTNICLITKDPQREYKDLLEQHNIKFISRVVGITKLKGKWKPFEARRLLLKENSMFLADDRVVPLLPGLLGKIFFEAKKQPIPVNLHKKDLRTELENAINSTYMHQNAGTCTSVKLATLTHTPSQVLDNLRTALPVLISRIRDGWDNIQSLHIKTSNSVSLPVWTCELGDSEGGRWHGMTAGQDDGEEWGGVGGANEDTLPAAAELVGGKRKATGVQDMAATTKRVKKQGLEPVANEKYGDGDEDEGSVFKKSKASKPTPVVADEPSTKKTKAKRLSSDKETPEHPVASPEKSKSKKTTTSESVTTPPVIPQSQPLPLKSALKKTKTPSFTRSEMEEKKKVSMSGVDKKKARSLQTVGSKVKAKDTIVGRKKL